MNDSRTNEVVTTHLVYPDPAPEDGPAGPRITVEDAQDVVGVDLDRWARLAHAVLSAERIAGELGLTFVDRDEITELNATHLGEQRPTDVLSFPIDTETAVASSSSAASRNSGSVPVLLGDIVICPEVAAANAETHAGNIDDELALLLIHGILHILGHDHAEPEDTDRMRRRELELLEQLHWVGPAPPGFSQVHRDG